MSKILGTAGARKNIPTTVNMLAAQLKNNFFGLKLRVCSNFKHTCIRSAACSNSVHPTFHDLDVFAHFQSLAVAFDMDEYFFELNFQFKLLKSSVKIWKTQKPQSKIKKFEFSSIFLCIPCQH